MRVPRALLLVVSLPLAWLPAPAREPGATSEAPEATSGGTCEEVLASRACGARLLPPGASSPTAPPRTAAADREHAATAAAEECFAYDFEGLGDRVPIGAVPGPPTLVFGPLWFSAIDFDVGGSGNWANEPSPETASLVFIASPFTEFINFDRRLRSAEIFYSAFADALPVVLTAWDGPDGTGNAIATASGSTIGSSLDGAPCGGDPSGFLCLWDTVTLTSPTSNILSVTLSSNRGTGVAYDDLGFCAAGCEALPPGAVSWWAGDGDADDRLGAHPGALIDGSFPIGMVEGAFGLDGVDDLVEVPHSPDLDPPEFSIDLWVFIDPALNAGGINAFAGKSNGSSGAGGYLLLHDDRQLMSLGNLPPAEALAATTNALRLDVYGGPSIISSAFLTLAFPSAGFYHVAGTFDGSEARLFLDGSPVATGAAIAGMLPNALSFRIGAAHLLEDLGIDDRFEGLVDEVELFDRALTVCEISALYAAGGTGKCRGNADGDNRADYADNCPDVSNPSQADGDGDGAGDACDCAPSDPGAFAVPPELCALSVGGPADTQTLAWPSIEFSAGADAVYDVLRGKLDELGVGGGASETCIGSGVMATSLADPDDPGSGEGFWYLVRGRTACGPGTYGFEGDGAERTSTACP